MEEFDRVKYNETESMVSRNKLLVKDNVATTLTASEGLKEKMVIESSEIWLLDHIYKGLIRAEMKCFEVTTSNILCRKLYIGAEFNIFDRTERKASLAEVMKHWFVDRLFQLLWVVKKAESVNDVERESGKDIEIWSWMKNYSR